MSACTEAYLGKLHMHVRIRLSVDFKQAATVRFRQRADFCGADDGAGQAVVGGSPWGLQAAVGGSVMLSSEGGASAPHGHETLSPPIQGPIQRKHTRLGAYWYLVGAQISWRPRVRRPDGTRPRHDGKGDVVGGRRHQQAVLVHERRAQQGHVLTVRDQEGTGACGGARRVDGHHNRLDVVGSLHCVGGEHAASVVARHGRQVARLVGDCAECGHSEERNCLRGAAHSWLAVKQQLHRCGVGVDVDAARLVAYWRRGPRFKHEQGHTVVGRSRRLGVVTAVGGGQGAQDQA
jgi:hypothetical protein